MRVDGLTRGVIAATQPSCAVAKVLPASTVHRHTTVDDIA